MAQGSSPPPTGVLPTAAVNQPPTPIIVSLHTKRRRPFLSVAVRCRPFSLVTQASSVLAPASFSPRLPQKIPSKTLILPQKTKKSAFFHKNWFAKFLKGAILYPCCAWKGGTRLIIKFSFEACDKKSDLEKNQKKFKIRFASLKKWCYIMKLTFSVVLKNECLNGWLKIE